MKAKEAIRYSEAFKQQVIEQLQEGKFNSPNAAARAYGITGTRTVQMWLRKYGRTDLLPKQITVQTMEEQDEKEILRQRALQFPHEGLAGRCVLADCL